ncbi:MAG: prepilin peptidase [Thiomonas sp.]|jgi:leader peptidase (prepilin peptidase)/N-methyltransferase
MPDFGALPLGFWVLGAGLLGLVVGSFLNVVIHRLPLMMERQWQADAHATLHPDAPSAPQERFDLIAPRSRCPACGHPIAWWENIPLLSYALLRGRCSACGTPISLRYPLVELITALLSAAVVWRWGPGWDSAAYLALLWALITLALIDFDTTLLPDSITLPLLWLGLIWQAGLHSERLPSAVWGAVIGYLSLWLVYQVFKLLTGKEGMGFGDFKLFAALGAWFGVAALLPIILLSSVCGAVIGIALQLLGRTERGRPIPFGPFLAAAGMVLLLIGPATLVALILPASGA